MTAEENREADIGDLSTRASGEDDFSYDDVDLESLPNWWVQAIEEHGKFRLRPYRPPRFADDAITPRVLERIEEEMDVDVRLQGKNVSVGDPWIVVVDGADAFEIPRRRDPNGYTVFEVESTEFIDRVEEHR